MEEAAKQSIIPEDWDDFVAFINQHRDEIAFGRYDLRIEKDWARDLTTEDLLLLIEHCPSSRLTIASATKSADVLERLATDVSSDVREAVADNVRTSTVTLDSLSNDPAAAVRMAVAENANVSAANLERLASDPVNYVRWGVAHNEKTPSAVLELIVEDQDGYVRDEARRNPNAPKRGFWSRLFKNKSR
ncbi:MAG TPA: hypothetical protein VKN18_24195 [Blastocatellia bacterium]|nr:hypothetical protein [Blastocatellia bacterium]